MPFTARSEKSRRETSKSWAGWKIWTWTATRSKGLNPTRSKIWYGFSNFTSVSILFSEYQLVPNLLFCSTGSNLIKQMNGMAIHKLVSLDRIDLRKNECISRWFSTEGSLEDFNQNTARLINGNCHFDESDPAELTREVDTDSLISEYYNFGEFKSEKLTGGVEAKNYYKLLPLLTISVIFWHFLWFVKVLPYLGAVIAGSKCIKINKINFKKIIDENVGSHSLPFISV